MSSSSFLILVFGGQNYNNVSTKIQLTPNKSMQVGDVIYKVTPSSSGGITTADINGSSTLEKIGVIKQIVDWNNGNGATGTNYGNINGNISSGIAYAMFPIDLDGDGTNETGDNNTYWANNTEISWNVDNSIITTGHGSYAVVIDIEGYESIVPTVDDYYFFSKDNNVNMSSITGYYAEVEFENNSTNKAEFFATACEITESSK
jgi:hypothetical protein